MKKRREAALVSAALVVSMLFGGCGNKGEAVQTSAGAAAAKEHVYKEELLNLGDIDTNNINDIFYYEDKIVVMGQRWEETGSAPEEGEVTPIEPRAWDAEDGDEEEMSSSVTESDMATEDTAEEAAEDDMAAEESAEEAAEEKIAVGAAAVDTIEEEIDEDVWYSQIRFLAVYDYEGNQISYIETEVPENEWMSWSGAGKGEEAIYCIMESYFEDNSDPDNYIWEEHRNLVKMKFDGTEEWKISLDKKDGEESIYVNSMICDTDGIYLFLGNGEVQKYNTDSTLAKTFKLETEDYGSVMNSSDGKIMLTIWGDEGGQYIKVFDKETGALSEKYKVPGNSYNYSYYGGSGYDLFLTDSTALYGYNLGDEEMTEIMNFIDSDLDAYSLYNVNAISDTQLYASYYSYSEDKHCYAKFTKVPPEEVVEKKVLTLGACYLDEDVRRRVVQFNKTNEQYRIQIKDYSTYNTETDYSQSYTRLNTDIISGNMPDILVLNSSLPVESYMAKGLFEDLYTYIDADEEMDRSDFMTNIFEAFSTNGKLYQLIPSFTVLTVAGRTADVGKETGWTLDELNTVMAAKPEGTKIFFDTTRETILNYCMQMSSEQFINWETGECSFDSEGFVKLLEFISQFPEEYDDSQYTDEFWVESESTYREGKTLLAISYLGQFSDFNMMEKGTFGEDITLIGFPAENRNGSVIDYSMSLGMSSKSSNKEGAWEFLRYFLSYDYQKDTYGFPTNLKRYEELKQEAMQKPYYYDENNNKVEYDMTYYIGDTEVIIPPMTEEEIQELEDFLFSLNQPSIYNEELLNIIKEEAAAYYAGQKGAEEVSKVIQSRVRIYVNENR